MSWLVHPETCQTSEQALFALYYYNSLITDCPHSLNDLLYFTVQATCVKQYKYQCRRNHDSYTSTIALPSLYYPHGDWLHCLRPHKEA